MESVHWLGSPVDSEIGFVMYSEPNFLGSRLYVTAPTGTVVIATQYTISSIELGSIAVTWKLKLRLCSDAECTSAICIDTTTARKNYYINKNVPSDTSLQWPIYVRAYQGPTDDAVCQADASPPIQKSLAVRSAEPLLQKRALVFL